MHPDASAPFVSVVLPIRNEGRYIRRSLEAVLAQDYRGRMEILVADGMSTDDTREIVRSFQSDHPNVRLIDNPEQIVAAGLNRLIAQAQGDILVRVDGHCTIAPDYVTACVKRLLGGADGVGGALDTIGETPVASAVALAMSTRFGVGDSAFRTGSDEAKLVDTVAFPAYWRTVVDRAGAFDEELVRNQDDEYNYRLRHLGARILLAPEIRSTYYSRSSIRSLWRQYFQYGYWKVRVMQKHPRQMRARQFVPPLFAACLLGSALLSLMASPGRWALTTVVGAYAVANITCAWSTSRGRGWKTFATLVLAYATLHLSYGFGFLVGCLRFIGRWAGQEADPKPLASATE
jgi:glycosyltransferase involved in cell wall biosynthesis